MKKQEVFDAFLALILSDEWDAMDEVDINSDLDSILLAALPLFKYPRVELNLNEEKEFVNTLTNNEVQVLAQWMKVVWYMRTVDSWENLKPLYAERDFSPAKMLGELSNRLTEQQRLAKKMETDYYRTIGNRPFGYGNLGGKSV